MPAETYSISIDDVDERTEEYRLPAGTVCLAAVQQMVVAHNLLIRGLWDEEDELYSVQLELRVSQDQLRILRQFRIVPKTVPDEMGKNVLIKFELDSRRVHEDVLADLADSEKLHHLVEAVDDFPPVLNLMHYRLEGLEISEPL